MVTWEEADTKSGEATVTLRTGVGGVEGGLWGKA
jgi:hypothetical protein